MTGGLVMLGESFGAVAGTSTGLSHMLNFSNIQ